MQAFGRAVGNIDGHWDYMFWPNQAEWFGAFFPASAGFSSLLFSYAGEWALFAQLGSVHGDWGGRQGV
jgi:hypothetical protein